MAISFWQRMYRWLCARKVRSITRLVVDDLGVSLVHGNEPPIRISWDEIVEIQGYKRDLVTVDLVCFDVEVKKGAEKMTYTIHEEMKGFEQVSHVFAKTLPGFDKEWRGRVVKPAFVENRTLLFGREGKNKNSQNM